MSDLNQPIWERQECDTELGWAAFSDYLRMSKQVGKGRTLRNLHATYTQPTRKRNTPTQSWRTLQSWYRKAYWKKRAIAWDAHKESQASDRVRDDYIEEIAAEAQAFRDDVKKIGISRINRVKQGENIANVLAAIAAEICAKTKGETPALKLAAIAQQLSPLNDLKAFKTLSELETGIAKATGGGGAVELLNLALGLDKALEETEVDPEG